MDGYLELFNLMDLQELLTDLGIDFRQVGEHHHATHGWISIDCPYCSPSSGHFRLGLNLRSRAANCWICGIKKFHEVLTELAGTDGRELLRSLHFDTSNDFPLSNKKPGKLRLPEGLGPLLSVHSTYLANRGFDPDTLVKLWGIQGFGLHYKYAWRIWIPVYYGGEIVSWLTRSTGEASPRYLNAPPEEEKLPLKNILFGIDYIRHAAILCEGPFDAMRIGPGAVSCFGLSYTRDQFCLFSKIPIRVVCFDAEEAAQQRARDLCRELAIFPGETVNISLETGKDPAEADEREIQELRRKFLD